MRPLVALVLLAGCAGGEPEPPPSEPAVEAAPEVAPDPAPDPAAAIDPDDVVMGLVAAPGRDKVLANCLACHSTALITQNHMTRERWDETLTWMQKKQGLWEIAPPDRALILDYLALTQGVDGAAGADTPWAQPRYRPNPLW